MTEVVVPTTEQPLFIKKRHELAGLLAKVKAGSAKAVEMLIETMDDEEVPIKTRVACAQSLIEYEVKITDQINKDQLTRQVAELKAKGALIPVNGNGQDRPLPPVVNFTDIQEV